MTDFKNIGTIEVVVGCMFSGKTNEFVRRLERAYYGKKKVIAFKPLRERRFKKLDAVVSRTKSEFPAIEIENSQEILAHFDGHDVVGIDEIQFLDDSLIDVVIQLRDRGCKVVLSGLDLDFRGEPFSVIPALLALANDIQKATAVCVMCGADACMSQRLIDGKPAYYDDPIILVGNTELYEARCRNCHEVPTRSEVFAVVS